MLQGGEFIKIMNRNMLIKYLSLLKLQAGSIRKLQADHSLESIVAEG